VSATIGRPVALIENPARQAEVAACWVADSAGLSSSRVLAANADQLVLPSLGYGPYTPGSGSNPAPTESPAPRRGFFASRRGRPSDTAAPVCSMTGWL
jgi:hypothetical protein